MGKLDGKVAVVTGSGRGIGAEIALKLAAVVVNDLDEQPARETAAAIERAGGKAAACPGNLTEVDIAQQFLDRCILELSDGALSPVDAAKAKWWTTELQGRVMDACVQLHGGYGYMLDYPIVRAGPIRESRGSAEAPPRL
jgi:NAD(P)-dependent dehydrogenase (short-subunit alcohol dehydrogenase family)